MQDETRRLSLDADSIDFTDFVADVNKAGSVGCAAVHYPCDHNLASDFAGFYGRPLMSRCKLVLSLRCISRARTRTRGAPSFSLLKKINKNKVKSLHEGRRIRDTIYNKIGVHSSIFMVRPIDWKIINTKIYRRRLRADKFLDNTNDVRKISKRLRSFNYLYYKTLKSLLVLFVCSFCVVWSASYLFTFPEINRNRHSNYLQKKHWRSDCISRNVIGEVQLFIIYDDCFMQICKLRVSSCILQI